MSQFPTCRAPECGLRIQFGVTDKGKRIPMDMSATDDGNIVWEADGVHVHVLTAHEQLSDRRPRFLSHFATCVARAEFRRRSTKVQRS